MTSVYGRGLAAIHSTKSSTRASGVWFMGETYQRMGRISNIWYEAYSDILDMASHGSAPAALLSRRRGRVAYHPRGGAAWHSAGFPQPADQGARADARCPAFQAQAARRRTHRGRRGASQGGGGHPRQRRSRRRYHPPRRTRRARPDPGWADDLGLLSSVSAAGDPIVPASPSPGEDRVRTKQHARTD